LTLAHVTLGYMTAKCKPCHFLWNSTHPGEVLSAVLKQK